MTTLAASLRYASRGLAVFPCWQNKKTPVTKSGLKEATTDPEIIKAWWSNYTEANIAVATGAASGVFAVDIDVKGDRNGEADLRALEDKHGPLPQTVESVTPSKGRHLWFRMPSTPVQNSVGKLGRGIDVRGCGGYVLVPPSYVDGDYVWSVDCASTFSEPPAWLVAAVAAPSFSNSSKPNGYWSDIGSGVGEGCRNTTMAELAGKLLRTGMTASQARDYLIWWNQQCRPPEDDQAVLRTVHSIVTREIRKLRNDRKF